MNKRYIPHFLLGLAFAILGLNASAQEIIDEDFLENIETNAKSLWEESIPAFANKTIPEKFKNESAVVIGFKRSVTIDKKSRAGFLSKGERSLLFFENVRFKIKLADRNAVSAFTEIYFRYSDKTDGFSAKVYKPNGEVSAVSLNDAVGVESVSNVPEFFKSFFDQQTGQERRYFKVAIPDLEPGDILEYAAITKSKLNVLGTGYIEFDPQFEQCSKKYPVLFNQINIETDDKSFFKSLSVNGAPEFKKESSAENGFFKYVFTDVDRNIEKDVNFINSYQVFPLVKFQVIYANNEKIKGLLIGTKGEIKTKFSKEELALKAWEDYEQVGDAYYSMGVNVQKLVNSLWLELKKQGAKDWKEKDYIEKAYYRLRNLVIFRDTYLNDKTAAYIFGSLLYQRDIKSELVIAVSNSLKDMSNILFDQEIRYAVKVNGNYYFNCTDHSNPGELVEELLGGNAYVIDEPKKDKTQTITPVQLPNATDADNTTKYICNAALATDMNTLVVSRMSNFKGISKSRNINDALRYTPYMLDDYKNYGGMAPTANLNSAQQTEYFKSIKALKDQYAESKPELVKSELQNDFHQKVKYKDFKLKAEGRTLKQKDLSFIEEFELQSMVRKAGKKILVNLPGLVGSQLQIKKEERERNHDISVGYARTLEWVINFKIPDGYTAAGLSELNTNVDNEAGSFSCSAEEKDGVATILIKKIYKQANLPKDKWASMLAFIDAAYNNSFKYILLKPKN